MSKVKMNITYVSTMILDVIRHGVA